MGIRPVRINETGAEKEWTPLAREPLEFRDGGGRPLGGAALVDVLHVPAPLGPGAPFMDLADADGLVAGVLQELTEVFFVGIQIPAEVAVRQPHDTVAVRKASREQRCPRRAAPRIRAERPRKPHALLRKLVEVGCLHGLHAVAMKVLPKIMAMNDHDVRLRHIGGMKPTSDGSRAAVKPRKTRLAVRFIGGILLRT